jgi:fluoroacetyl-CoA thioesterase
MTTNLTTTSDGLRGASATREFVVGAADTAASVGSGDLPVLATPRLLAYAEATTVAALGSALDADPGEPPSVARTSVGSRVRLDHLRASPVGATIRVYAEVTHVDGRLLRFAVVARQDDVMVAEGEITRVIVDSHRFMARLATPPSAPDAPASTPPAAPGSPS